MSLCRDARDQEYKQSARERTCQSAGVRAARCLTLQTAATTFQGGNSFHPLPPAPALR